MQEMLLQPASAAFINCLQTVSLVLFVHFEGHESLNLKSALTVEREKENASITASVTSVCVSALDTYSIFALSLIHI